MFTYCFFAQKKIAKKTRRKIRREDGKSVTRSILELDCCVVPNWRPQNDRSTDRTNGALNRKQRSQQNQEILGKI